MKDTKPRRPPHRILRKPDVLALVNVSATTLWRMVRRGDFPASFRISPGLVGWYETDVDLWIEERRRSQTAHPSHPRASDSYKS